MQIKLPNDTSPWARRIALYLSLGAAVILASHLVFFYFDFLHTDVDSARYMLSALVQGEAAIVALVVTLSLVAVQLAAQSYSARVIEVFRRTPDLWILMGIYGIAIFYGLGVLKLIENPLVGRMSNLEGYVSFSYYLGVFAFVALVPYIWNILELLKPSTVINMFAERITKKSILATIEEELEKSNEKDPIQPIIDIVRGSLMKYDYETVRDGLKAIGDRTSHIFKNETFENVQERNLSEHLFAHLTRVGKLAASRGDEDSILEVITNLHKNGETAAERKLDEVTGQGILHIGLVGTGAAKQMLNEATHYAIASLGSLGMTAAKQELKSAKYAVVHLGLLGKIAAENKFEPATKEAAAYLESVGKAVATEQAIEYLKEILKISKEQKLEDAAPVVAEYLQEISENKVLTPARSSSHSSPQSPESS